jgi:transcriptional regulator with XRE-family HTH domain
MPAIIDGIYLAAQLSSFDIETTAAIPARNAVRDDIMAVSRKRLPPLGDRVRGLRRDHDMTLAQLAKKSGISAATLSKLENGLTGLTLDNVIRLAAAFGMPVSMLLNEPDPRTGAVSVSHEGSEQFHDVDQLGFHVLHYDLPLQRNVFWRVRVKAHSLKAFGPFHAHPGEEFFYVLSGRVKFHLRGRDPIVLKVGESVQFDSAIEHAYVSSSRADAVILMSNTIAHDGLPGFLDAAKKPAAKKTRSR